MISLLIIWGVSSISFLIWSVIKYRTIRYPKSFLYKLIGLSLLGHIAWILIISFYSLKPFIRNKFSLTIASDFLSMIISLFIHNLIL